jgi:hypothetical protein
MNSYQDTYYWYGELAGELAPMHLPLMWIRPFLGAPDTTSAQNLVDLLRKVN